MNNPTFTHLLNPITESTNAGLFAAQSISFETLKIALQDAAAADILVDTLMIHYKEDQPHLNIDYTKFAQIENSVLDYGQFSIPRKLPLLRELLDVAHANSEAEYLIYTNIDICLIPYFYQSITNIIKSGTQSFTITRRTIPQPPGSDYPLTALFADVGEPHRGWDCFIFPRSYVPFLNLRNLCIGAPLVGLGLLANLLVLDPKFKEFRQYHLTFHIGNDRDWNNPINKEYTNHNKAELMLCLSELRDRYGAFPDGSPPQKYLSFRRHFIMRTFYEWLSARFHLPARYFRQ